MRALPTVVAALLLSVLVSPVTAAALAPRPDGATASASYQLDFEATWSAATHPVGFPPAPHFSPLVGGTHDASSGFWAPGALATTGIEQMAELGSTSALSNEVNAAVNTGSAGQVILGGGVGLSPGGATASFTATLDHPLVSVVTMIAPSPDWFLGVSGLSLLDGGDWVDSVSVDLFAWDAGTDSGANYTSPDQDTDPANPITLLTSSPFDNGTKLGTFTFTRTDTPGVFTEIGPGLAGTHGVPTLSGTGTLVALAPFTLDLSGALENSSTALVVGFSVASVPFKGGTLVPVPDLVLAGLPTDGSGALSLPAALPAGVPAGVSLVFQSWTTDGAAVKGLSATQGLCAVTP